MFSFNNFLFKDQGKYIKNEAYNKLRKMVINLIEKNKENNQFDTLII